MGLRTRDNLRDNREEALLAFQQGVRERWNGFEDVFYDRLVWISRFLVKGWSWVSKRHILLQYSTVAVGFVIATLFGRMFWLTEPLQSQLLLYVPVVLLGMTYGGIIAGTITSLVGAVLAMIVAPTPQDTLIQTHVGNFRNLPFVPYLLYFMVCVIMFGLWKLQERKQSDIVRLNDELEDRVRERTAELQAANEELSNFCYSISHDLRAPMRNIAASSALLNQEMEGKIDDTNRELIQGIGRSATRLSDLVDALLNHARLGNAALKPRWVNVTGMADEIGHSLRREDWPCRTIEFRIQPNMVVTADPLLLKLALHNLMENACKYSQAGSDLVVEVKEMRTRTGAIFAVKDNGIGFDMQSANKVFEPFQRLHRDSDYPGTGIGLANVKRIIERHDGRVWVESKPGVGSTFFFTIGELKKTMADLPETEQL